MQIDKSKIHDFEFERLVRGLLKIDPAALDWLSARPGSGGAAAGLHQFMRIVLERSLALLWAPAGWQVEVRAIASPDRLGNQWRLFNLIQVCSWALVREPRRMRGLTELRLCEADAKVRIPPWEQFEDRDHRPVEELALLANTLFESEFDAIRDAPAPLASISVRALIADLLGVRPEALIRLYYDRSTDAEAAFERDPDGQAMNGLSALLTRVLRHHQMLLKGAEADDYLWMQIEDDATYDGPDGAAAANLGYLLLAGSLANGARDVGFVGNAACAPPVVH